MLTEFEKRNFQNLRIGGIYRDGYGKTHKIVRIDSNGSIYDYRTDDPSNCGYYRDGRYAPCFKDRGNLIEEIFPEELRKLKQLINMMKPDGSFYEKKHEILALLDTYVELR